MQEHTDWVLAEPTGLEWFDWRNVVVTDCEANGLLDKPDYHMHCGWNYDLATREYRGFRPHEIKEYIASFKGKVVVAHNGLGYDYLALRMEAERLGVAYEPALEVDTLVLCRMLWAIDDLLEPDIKLWRANKMPGNKMKTQGIEAWGYRLGEMKGDYSEARKVVGRAMGITDPKALTDFVWATFNEDMFSYNKQDVTVNVKLLLLVFKKLGWFQTAPLYSYPAAPVATEHMMQTICLAQENRGLGFDLTKAVKLAGELDTQRTQLAGVVAAAFKPWWAAKPEVTAPAMVRRRQADLPQVTIRRWSAKTDKELAPEFNHPWSTTDAGNRFVPVTYTHFALSNRHHLASRLVAVYGWKPKTFGGAKGTDPVVDEATISAISDTVLAPALKKAILDYYVIDKTYSTLASGNSAWMRLYDEDTGTIHGRCNPLGTITHRASHDKPNLGNIPSVELDEEKDASGKVVSKTAIDGIAGGFGNECRGLFGPADPFDTETGTDVYALEVFMLAQYLFPFDGGTLAAKLANPGFDIHTDNASICGLTRKDVKTTFYKTMYGSGALDIGRDVWKPEDKVADWKDAPGVKSWINWNQEKLGDMYKMPSALERALYGKGKLYQNKLLNGIPGLKDFKKDVTRKAKERGYLIAIDGRRLSIRKEFAALNALLQGSGAIACKVWIITMREMLIAKGLLPSVLHPGTGRIIKANDWNQIAWVHDETQNESRGGIGEEIGRTSQDAIAEASRRLKLKVTLRADWKVGSDWAVCH